MKVVIQSAKIVSPGSPYHLKRKNVVISGGRITEIGDKNYSADRVIEADGMLLSIGWMDLGAFVGDPGLEHKEDLLSLTKAAAAGGFTEVVLLPNTHPAVQSKNEISYITQANATRLVQLHPMAAVTKNCKGEELTEMIDLHEAGAVAFTDGLKSLVHTDLFLKSLQYIQKFDGLLIDHAEDHWLNLFGQMHEGETSTSLGLKGMPRIAEEIAVRKNLELLEYAGGRLHFSRISTARTVDLIRSAKKKGMKVSCDVVGYQPLLDDSCLEDFDTNYKLNPPLREKSDNDALLKGLKDGTIDVLSSGHLPQDDESKLLEFDQADFGITNLQTFAAQLVQLSKWVDVEELIAKVTTAPRLVLQLPVPIIEVDEKANLTLFDPNREWRLDEKTNFSKSKNSPWWGQELKGKAVAVFNNNKQWIDA
ncbi:MAG: dihydroorotase [Cytophagales bacterium]|jgi:dihydroorotase|nr:dihydroorotase [Cytophagales bacterium]MCA6388045.1 dihydroorotase [Cytophagales bacterium]MCA6391074.1 dihydroorotase [Cytophagales bacterium]MCA6394795.1 dihydroorotase [Cytophagales bacterium]MCA6399826.1 dihydroorotase [Cytophagales bacterium]